MFKTILDIYQSTSDIGKLALKEKLKSIQMSKDEPIVTYLSKFTKVGDELGGVGVIVPEHDLVSLALLGLHKSWYGFQDAVSGRESFPSWERLWIDCVQEEIQRGTRYGRLMKTDDENFALASKSSKAKGKEGQGVVESS